MSEDYYHDVRVLNLLSCKSDKFVDLQVLENAYQQGLGVTKLLSIELKDNNLRSETMRRITSWLREQEPSRNSLYIIHVIGKDSYFWNTVL